MKILKLLLITALLFVFIGTKARLGFLRTTPKLASIHKLAKRLKWLMSA